MTTITPPPPPAPPPPPTGGQPVILVDKPPQILQQIPPNTRIDVQVTDALAKGAGTKNEITLQLPQGKVTVETPLPLPKGALLNLVVQPQGNKIQLLIQTINGNPAAATLKGTVGPSLPGGMGGNITGTQATGTVAGGQAPGGPVTGTPPTLPNIPLTPGQIMTATLLRPATFSPLSQTGPAGQGTGQLNSPATGTPPQGSVVSGRGNAPTGPALTGNSQTGTPGPFQAGSTIPTGSRLTVQITALGNQPGTAIQTNSPAATGIGPSQVLTGTISGTATLGQPIFQSQHGMMALNTSANINQGTPVAIEIKSHPVPPAETSTTTSLFARETLVMGRHWQTLTEAVQTLKQTSPDIAQQLTGGTIPKPDAQLAANILMFMGALKGGEVKNWLGDGALRALGRSKPQTQNKLSEEFKTASLLADEPNQQDWRINTIPLLNGEEIEKIRLLTRQQKEDDEEEDKPKGTRFVLDLELSKMGHMQLDGLANGPEKRLDLIIRTDIPLETQIQNDIRTIFEEANKLTGVSGGISFQSKPANFVEITTVPKDETPEGYIA